MVMNLFYLRRVGIYVKAFYLIHICESTNILAKEQALNQQILTI